MRTYRHNSPEAAGRIVALALLADGHVCRSEIEALERLDASGALGLAPDAMPRLLRELSEDLVAGLCATGSLLASLDDATLGALLREVDDPRLQAEVMRLLQAAAEADRHLADGEHRVIEAARRHWDCEPALA